MCDSQSCRLRLSSTISRVCHLAQPLGEDGRWGGNVGDRQAVGPEPVDLGTVKRPFNIKERSFPAHGLNARNDVRWRRRNTGGRASDSANRNRRGNAPSAPRLFFISLSAFSTMAASSPTPNSRIRGRVPQSPRAHAASTTRWLHHEQQRDSSTRSAFRL